MSKFLFASVFCLSLISFSAYSVVKNRNASFNDGCFVENHGQIQDQNGNARPDIQYVLRSGGVSVFMGNGQLHYEFVRNRPCGWNYKQMPGLPPLDEGAKMLREWTDRSTSEVETYRMDVTLVGADPHAIAIPGEPLAYYENYSAPGGEKKQFTAHTFSKITYRNVYPDIDWVIYLNGGRMEHEFVVRPGGDPSQIRLRYDGQTALSLQDDGSLLAETPMGAIKELAPVCYSGTGGDTRLAGAFQLQDNVLSYKFGNYSGTLIIDPIVEWGTYYGNDSSTSPVYAMTFDNAANVYMCGLTYSAVQIATVGSYQSVYGGQCDGYIAVFDSAGNRLWATYFGGDQGDWGTGICLDNAGSIYLTGATGSLSGIATTGAHQTTFGGGEWDGYLAKFTHSGALLWASYYGGSGSDIPYSDCSDNLGHVYIAGFTNSSNNIGTSNGFLPTAPGGYDAFLAQFDTSGHVAWGTFYGGTAAEFNASCAAYGFNVYLTGWTASSSGISTPGCWQPTFGGGGGDAFVARFDSSGARLWGSYYGGNGPETMGGITVAPSGNIYILGSTGSTNAIASSGCFQPAFGGGSTDAFLMKLDPEEGFRMWGTYFGGENDENVDLSRIVTDDSENVLIDGYTASTTGIASAGAWQSIYGGGDDDAFFAKFTTAGAEEWSTYYGGAQHDGGQAVGFDGKNDYLGGETSSPEGIATPDAFLTVGGAGPFYFQGFLAKFMTIDTASPLAVTGIAGGTGRISVFPSPNNGSFTISGSGLLSGSAQLSVTGSAGTVVWSGGASIVNGVLSVPVTLSQNLPAGVYEVAVRTGGKAWSAGMVKQ